MLVLDMAYIRIQQVPLPHYMMHKARAVVIPVAQSGSCKSRTTLALEVVEI